MEPPYEKLDGVINVISGYSGGHKENPTYKEVTAGSTGHRESVQITFDPSRIRYEELLNVFWKQVDPTDPGGQFADRGSSYMTAIFYHDEDQKKAAEESKKELERSGRYKKPIVTEILPASTFYKAEEYHQDYPEKNPIRYKLYRFYSGRDQYLNKVWDDEKDKEKKEGEEKKYMKPSKEEIKETLTPLQYHITQENGTEKAFDNEYWDNKKEGIYVDVVSGDSNPAPDGRALQDHLNLKISWKRKTKAFSRREQKFGAKTLTHTSVTCLMTVPSPPVSATASTLLHSVSFPRKTLKKRGT
jgi:peptide methionine sulfoxide reductase msrA/msrB